MPADRSAKREQVLDAAAGLFLTGGYGRTSMDAVTRAAGVSKQTVYAHFPSKDELFLAVLTRELDQLPSRTATLPVPTDVAALRESLVQFALATTRVLGRPHTAALLRMVLAEATHVPQVREAFRENLPLAMLGRLRDLLQASADAGVVTLVDADAHAHLFFGALVVHAGLDGIFGPGEAGLDEPTARRLVAAFVDGMLPR